MLSAIVFISPQRPKVTDAAIFRYPQFQYHQFYQMIWFTCRWEHYVQIVLLRKQQRVCLKFIFTDAYQRRARRIVQKSMQVKISGPREYRICLVRGKSEMKCALFSTPRNSLANHTNLKVVHPGNQPRHTGSCDS